MKRLNFIRDSLVDLTVLRNKIAHAKWYTLDKEGFVRLDTKTSKDGAFLKFRKFKITPVLIRKALVSIEKLDAIVSAFTDVIWQQDR